MDRRNFLKVSALGVAGCALEGTFGVLTARGEVPITFGLTGAASGPGGISGEASRNGVMLWAEQVNKRGGLLGREVQVVQRDSLGKPEEAVRYTREFATGGKTDFIFAHGSSAESFAVAAVSKDLKRLVTSTSEATEFTADPAIRSPYCYRFSTNTLLSGIAFGQYAARIAKEQGLNNWFTIGADYAFGRDMVGVFTQYLKAGHPSIEIKGQAWPKLFEPDYTPHINAIMAAKPDAVMTPFWGNDLVGFIKQASMYGLFEKTKLFSTHLGDTETFNQVAKTAGKVPAGLHARVRCLRDVPGTAVNREFYDAYQARYGSPPLYWAYMNYIGATAIEGAVRKAGSVDNAKVMKALDDLRFKAPGGAGAGDTAVMRGRDHQLIHYSEAAGVTTSTAPYLTSISYGNWDKLLADESAWLKQKGWL